MVMITSCSSNSYTNGSGHLIKGLNEYQLNMELLTEEDELQLLACSMVYNDDLDTANFSQIIAVNLTSGDTVNIIVPIRTISSKYIGPNDFYFKTWDKDLHSQIAAQDAYSKSIFNIKDVGAINNEAQQLKIDSFLNYLNEFKGLFVYVDDKMADQFKNTHSTTIGYLVRK